MTQQTSAQPSPKREPARDRYDAIVDLACDGHVGTQVYALVKQTFRITDRGLRLDAPEPLLHDLRDDTQQPCLVPGTDFWPVKHATDVVVQGSAFAPEGRMVHRMEASVSVGRATKRALVFGRRSVEWSRGSIRFTDPEPFEEVPLTYERAYGGIDFRVVDSELREVGGLIEQFHLQGDHPGLYPRNPFGKGYLVHEGPVADVELPQVEDPQDLLVPEGLITRDPRHWYRQPLPWCFDWVHPMMFPRYVYFPCGPAPWYPGPDDKRLPEVERGFLMEGYSNLMAERPLEEGPDAAFYQGASHGMVFRDLEEGTPVQIAGMHPTRPRIGFRLPPPPRIELQCEGERKRVRPSLHSVVCRPADEQVHLVYGAAMPTTRAFVPGIHKHIPLALIVGEDEPIVYEPPAPVRKSAPARED